MTSIAHIFPAELFATGHYEALPRQVIDTLIGKGIPVTGDWMIRGVTYGELTVTYGSNEVTFNWCDLGEEPPESEEDGYGLI